MLETDSLQIEKPWAVYGWFTGNWDIGRVLRYNGDSPQIQYTERQMYPLESWDPEWVKSFKTVAEAIDYFVAHQSFTYEDPYFKGSILRKLSINFPTAIKQEKQNELTSLVSLLSNLSHSQSSPKCTENSRYQFGPCTGCIKQEKTC